MIGKINLKEIISEMVGEFERKLIVAELNKCGWNVSRTASSLKMSRKGLQLRMIKFLLRDQAPEKTVTPVKRIIKLARKGRASIPNTMRYKILERDKGTCQCCGRNYQNSGVMVHIDHIKPVSKYPELAKVESNLQVLCENCNHAKAAKYETNWKQAQYAGS